MIEREKTYLAKFLPSALGTFESVELIDIYFPVSAAHPNLRLRKKGNKYELTKKTCLVPPDSSTMIEETINLSIAEFEALASLPGKKIRKIRYLMDYQGYMAEFDVFQDDLKGLVLVDVEFETEGIKNDFKIPDFCLADVTQEEFIAGGMLCGKKFHDIKEALAKYGYNKL